MKILKLQFWHILILLVLLYSVCWIVESDETILEGSLWGVTTVNWLIFAIIVPILHQVYVLVCWRIELYSKSISKALGKSGFVIYRVIFAILILLRPVSLVILAISNAGTANINAPFSYVLSGILLIPAIYLFYSVKKYFGMERAFGIDHFYPEEIRKIPMVKKGIFKYTSNGMYIFGFFILWIPGLLFFSKAALLVALFNHIYIWVHYYFTELPDMKVIYQDELN